MTIHWVNRGKPNYFQSTPVRKVSVRWPWFVGEMFGDLTMVLWCVATVHNVMNKKRESQKFGLHC